ncbi:hypothetical protein GCM10019059_29550 [Camelimonas fluminis]|uniref:Uncharacterized protein n=1 Tax=Camelimonas fluminis TaxID=1576911 RepID=A0ABV7UIW5_9HYPH|nr:hypothetical protein [Camelimonas fluminis]GHE67872.1 hypothetical protein GCM10019059_29550 [Camelimonas fluminis]
MGIGASTQRERDAFRQAEAAFAGSAQDQGLASGRDLAGVVILPGNERAPVGAQAGLFPQQDNAMAMLAVPGSGIVTMLSGRCSGLFRQHPAVERFPWL